MTFVVDEVALVGLAVEDCLLAPSVLQTMLEVSLKTTGAEDLGAMAMLSALMEVSDELASVGEDDSPTA